MKLNFVVLNFSKYNKNSNLRRVNKMNKPMNLSFFNCIKFYKRNFRKIISILSQLLKSNGLMINVQHGPCTGG